MNAACPWADAVAIRNGRLLAVGDEASVRAGRMVMPGIIDVHNHLIFAGRAELYETYFAPTLTLQQVLEQVRQEAAKQLPDGWVIGGIWGSGLLSELGVVPSFSRPRVSNDNA